jgi:hypothetical protein
MAENRRIARGEDKSVGTCSALVRGKTQDDDTFVFLGKVYETKNGGLMVSWRADPNAWRRLDEHTIHINLDRSGSR